MINTLLMSESTVSSALTELTTAVGGIFSLAGEGFNFITNNGLCMIMVGLSFAGAALGLVGRAFRVSRR